MFNLGSEIRRMTDWGSQTLPDQSGVTKPKVVTFSAAAALMLKNVRLILSDLVQLSFIAGLGFVESC